ncbi:Lipopolysaccharide assembly protein A [Candidatus Erwinia haradaeae]|uniref:Lipopolysaccharide assembly protein A n=1 Tax=Candidatus Erwinia haradaeae TaxID=1922217 RepID=A0A451DD38_9GAMM|nr:lipopolysaccharide assembly protein LapA domain-containing protein [Candidatus Erwinia haradaeae]VFP84382.1 Lipopolysaccharide assembly protein A [Candidatus Erwinia haradaeae]
MKYFLIFLVIIVMLVFSIILGAHNDQVITFNYLIGQDEFHIATLLAIVFSIGFFLSWIICGMCWLRVRVSLAHMKRKVIRLQSQLEVKENAILTSKNLSLRNHS